MGVRIIQGDCRNVLATLPDKSVHCVVTSPPYWNLRDYQVANQIGLEATIDAYVETMVAVFREVRRVLRRDGTCWINLGDGFKDKQLIGMPWRVAFALQADGWWLRQDIIWAKPNAMPESVTDRCTKAHEYLFLLSKSANYFYDIDAIREPHIEGTHSRGGQKKSGTVLVKSDSWNDLPPTEHPAGCNRRSVWEIATHAYPEAHFATFPPALVEPCIKAGTSEKGCCAKCGAPWVREVEKDNPHQMKGGTGGNDPTKAIGPMNRGGNGQWDVGHPINVRDVKTLGWSPSCSCFGHFKEADGPEDSISGETGERKKVRVYVPDGEQPPPVPAICLDPFGGAGTVGLVADRLGRNVILIELSESYAAMAERRIKGDAGLFAAVENRIAAE